MPLQVLSPGSIVFVWNGRYFHPGNSVYQKKRNQKRGMLVTTPTLAVGKMGILTGASTFS
jgi:hypothetical protein